MAGKKEKTKKEKKPREKPEKKTRPKKERKPGKKRGKKKLLLLLPAAVLLAGVLAGYLLIFRSPERRLGDRGEDTSAAQAGDGSASSSAGDTSAGDTSAGETPEEGQPPPEDPEPVKTVTESLEYIQSLPPKALGLEGDSMAAYEILPTGGTVLVDGHQCTKVTVYLREESGSNRYMGEFLLDRRAGGTLYSLDSETGAVTPVDLSG